LKKTDLNSLFPKDITCASSLIGHFDESTFRCSGSLSEGGLTVAAEETVFRKQIASISLLLSDVEIKEGSETSILACGVLQEHGLGRLYSGSSDASQFASGPYLLADVAIFSGDNECSINLFNGETLLLHLYVKAAVLETFLRRLEAGHLSRLIVDAEVWRSDDRQETYLRADRDQRLNGDIALSVDDHFAALSFSFEELQSALICRHAGEEIISDDDSAFSRRPKKAYSLMRLLVTFIEIVAGLLFVYWNMH
jgi:hypothetical protein